MSDGDLVEGYLAFVDLQMAVEPGESDASGGDGGASGPGGGGDEPR